MYKGVAEGLRRATAVHKIAPQKGYVGDERLPELEAMSLAELVDEKTRLNRELARYESEIGVAKRHRPRDLAMLCAAKASVEHRLSAVNERSKQLRRVNDGNCWRQAVREVVPEQAEAVIARVAELQAEAAGRPV